MRGKAQPGDKLHLPVPGARPGHSGKRVQTQTQTPRVSHTTRFCRGRGSCAAWFRTPARSSFLPGGRGVAPTDGPAPELRAPCGHLDTPGEDEDGPSAGPGSGSQPVAIRWVGRGEAAQYSSSKPLGSSEGTAAGGVGLKTQRFYRRCNLGVIPAGIWGGFANDVMGRCSPSPPHELSLLSSPTAPTCTQPRHPAAASGYVSSKDNQSFGPRPPRAALPTLRFTGRRVRQSLRPQSPER